MEKKKNRQGHLLSHWEINVPERKEKMTIQCTHIEVRLTDLEKIGKENLSMVID